jgi:hypothetical protein
MKARMTLEKNNNRSEGQKWTEILNWKRYGETAAEGGNEKYDTKEIK